MVYKETHMKKIMYLVVLSAFALSVSAFANEGICGKDKAEKRVEHLQQKLGLNAEQTAKVRSIFDAKAVEVKALMEKTHAEVSAVLTPEQKSKFEAMKKERGDKWRKHHSKD